jgi:hypothetical protein
VEIDALTLAHGIAKADLRMMYRHGAGVVRMCQHRIRKYHHLSRLVGVMRFQIL